METKTMAITTFGGITFPGLLIDGILSDSRTGERCKSADKWEEITDAEYEALCEAYNLND